MLDNLGLVVVAHPIVPPDILIPHSKPSADPLPIPTTMELLPCKSKPDVDALFRAVPAEVVDLHLAKREAEHGHADEERNKEDDELPSGGQFGGGGLAVRVVERERVVRRLVDVMVRRRRERLEEGGGDGSVGGVGLGECFVGRVGEEEGGWRSRRHGERGGKAWGGEDSRGCCLEGQVECRRDRR